MFRERIRDIGSRVYAYFLEPVFPLRIRDRVDKRIGLRENRRARFRKRTTALPFFVLRGGKPVHVDPRKGLTQSADRFINKHR